MNKLTLVIERLQICGTFTVTSTVLSSGWQFIAMELSSGNEVIRSIR